MQSFIGLFAGALAVSIYVEHVKNKGKKKQNKIKIPEDMIKKVNLDEKEDLINK